jgi:integration host factor subunit beta
MTKADLVEEVTQLGDLTRRDGEMIVDTIFDSVIHALRTGDKIEIRGFGSSVSASLVPDGTPRQGLKSTCQPSEFPTSSPARNCAIWSTPGTRRLSRTQTSLNPPPRTGCGNTLF